MSKYKITGEREREREREPSHLKWLNLFDNLSRLNLLVEWMCHGEKPFKQKQGSRILNSFSAWCMNDVWSCFFHICEEQRAVITEECWRRLCGTKSFIASTPRRDNGLFAAGAGVLCRLLQPTTSSGLTSLTGNRSAGPQNYHKQTGLTKSLPTSKKTKMYLYLPIL